MTAFYPINRPNKIKLREQTSATGWLILGASGNGYASKALLVAAGDNPAPGTPPLFFQPTAGSAYLTGTAQPVEGNTLQVDYYGNTRNASSPAIGPLEPMANNTGIVPPMRF